MSLLAKIFMFLSSYSPLYILTMTLNYKFSDIVQSIIKITDIKHSNYSDILLYSLLYVIQVPL